jgi:uncharacterized phosphosugar-binding protein
MKFKAINVVREVDYSATDLFRRIQEIGKDIGSVKDVNPSEGTLMINSRYGLNPVKVSVAIRAKNSTASTIKLFGHGQDIWGSAAKRVIDRIVAEL